MARQEIETLEAVRKEMAGEPAETQIEYRMDCVLRELDEFMALAANPETVGLIEKQRIMVGQIMSRAQLIASFLMSRKPGPTLVYRR